MKEREKNLTDSLAVHESNRDSLFLKALSQGNLSVALSIRAPAPQPQWFSE
jgi:hypothetical protein